MYFIPWQPALSEDELKARSNPVQANQPEIIPHALYDTQTIANTNVGPFNFFAAVNADKTLSNMDSAGQLPDPQFFRLYYMAADLLRVPNNNANVLPTSVADVANILKATRATFTFTMSNKNYGPFPLTMCAATGGVTGAAYGYGALAAGVDVFAVNNGIPGSGGFPFGGAILIPPKVTFSVTVAVSAAVTLGANLNLRMTMVGVLYRRVL